MLVKGPVKMSLKELKWDIASGTGAERVRCVHQVRVMNLASEEESQLKLLKVGNFKNNVFA